MQDAKRPSHIPRTRTLVSPIGPLTLVAVGDELAEVRLPDEPTAGRRAGWKSRERAAAADPSLGADPPGTLVLVEAARQLTAYFAGGRRAFELPLALRGTPFQLAVWRELLRVPFGTTVTYAELAARVGRPGAARAVGRAVGQNPLAVVVPCHRVIGADRGLTGYGGGLEAKAALLALEAGVSPEAAPCPIQTA